jgi:NADH-quinone oxidoreductase subunit H
LTLLTLIFPIISVVFFTLGERRVMNFIQRRKGPNISWFWDVLQPFAYALKLIIKEIILWKRTIMFLFLLALFLILYFSSISWAVVIHFITKSIIPNLFITAPTIKFSL